MSDFESSWLALREPADQAARNHKVRSAVLDGLPNEAAQILDIASGTGSTFRALSSFISVDQDWHLVDQDEDLLSMVQNPEPDRLTITTERVDLAKSLSNIIGQEFSNGQPADLVTTSAFLDLVSRRWLGEFVNLLIEIDRPFYGALTYDGRLTFAPEHPLDSTLQRTLNSDQKTDKGFGTALGPDAHATFRDLLQDKEFSVVDGPSDWDLGDEQSALQTAFVNGLFDLAVKSNAANPSALEDWRNNRQSAIGLGQSRIIVGHQDLLAVPKG